MSVRCYLVTKDDAGRVQGAVTAVSLPELAPGEVAVDVAFSSLNYKDALAASGHPGVARQLPHIPGIDAAGTLATTGDPVIVTGFELGAGRWGAYAERIHVPAEWVLPLPAGLSPRDAMVYGTAGLTAALMLDEFLKFDLPRDAGPVVVTGASGGVGSLAVALLAKQGYHVVASTGKPAAHDLLRSLGAAEIIGRDAVVDASAKPLLSARWAGAIDTVGGATLAGVLKAMKQHGIVTACGLVAGAELHTTVMPFLLRGIRLIGIDTAWYPLELRRAIWDKLAGPWRPANLDQLTTVISLDEVAARVEQMLRGEAIGRVVVKVG